MGLFDKMKNVFAPDDDDYYDDDLGMEEDEEQEPLYNPRNNDYSSSGPSYRRRELRADSKVVNINTNIQMQVRIINPVK